MLLLAFRRPPPPHRRLLLGDTDQHDLPVATLGRRRVVDQRTGERFFVLTLGEVHHRDRVSLGEAVDVLHVRVADLAERRGRRDRESALPPQEVAYEPDRLELRGVALQEDPVHRPARQRHLVPK